ncbi:MAG: hypothetical protein ACKVPJ_11395 [Chitinophagales bacterium]
MLLSKKVMVVPAMLVSLVLFMTSCSKEQILPVDDEALLSNEILERQPSPGMYTISRFIDTGGDETAQFSGYTFEFQEDGGFIATTNTGSVFEGFWDLNTAETMMEISITGTAALDDLDDDNWTVNRITDLRIRISAPGPDRVQFAKM